MLWDEIRLREFENGLLRSTIGLKMQEARKACKKAAQVGVSQSVFLTISVTT
jgi:hypothetical protein